MMQKVAVKVTVTAIITVKFLTVIYWKNYGKIL